MLYLRYEKMLPIISTTQSSLQLFKSSHICQEMFVFRHKHMCVSCWIMFYWPNALARFWHDGSSLGLQQRRKLTSWLKRKARSNQLPRQGDVGEDAEGDEERQKLLTPRLFLNLMGKWVHQQRNQLTVTWRLMSRRCHKRDLCIPQSAESFSRMMMIWLWPQQRPRMDLFPPHRSSKIAKGPSGLQSSQKPRNPKPEAPLRTRNSRPRNLQRLHSMRRRVTRMARTRTRRVTRRSNLFDPHPKSCRSGPMNIWLKPNKIPQPGFLWSNFSRAPKLQSEAVTPKWWPISTSACTGVPVVWGYFRNRMGVGPSISWAMVVAIVSTLASRTWRAVWLFAS